MGMRSAGLAANPTTQTSPAGREHEEGEFGGPLWWLWRVRRWRALRWPRCALRWLRRALRPLRLNWRERGGGCGGYCCCCGRGGCGCCLAAAVNAEEGQAEHEHVEDGAAQARGRRRGRVRRVYL